MSAALVQWLQCQGGYVHPSCDLFLPLPNGDRGVCCTADVPADTQLVVVPVAATLHLPTADKQGATLGSSGGPPLAAAACLAGYQEAPSIAAGLGSQGWSREGQVGGAGDPADTSVTRPRPSPFVATVLLLMAEMARGESSPWSAYLGALPKRCDCLLSWSDEAKEELQGTSCEDLTGGGATRAEWQRDVLPLVSSHPELWPPPYDSLQEFVRVAGLVQSRAFHMEAENFLDGTKKEGQELYLIPGIDQINHASDPRRRNTLLCKHHTPMEVTDARGTTHHITAFFSLKTSVAVKAGEQLLHTYGDLSDAQLLTTYGFVDQGPGPQPRPPPPSAHPPASGSKGKASGKRTAKLGTGEGRQQQQGGGGPVAAAGGAGEQGSGGGGSGFVNPHNFALVPYSAAAKVCGALLQQALPGSKASARKLSAAKQSFLVEAGLLQAAAPAASEFVVSQQRPLPDQLLTTVQVLLMAEEEFHELRRQYRAGGFDSSDDEAEGGEGEEGEEEEEEGGEDEGEKGEEEDSTHGKGAGGAPGGGRRSNSSGGGEGGQQEVKLLQASPAAVAAFDQQVAALQAAGTSAAAAAAAGELGSRSGAAPPAAGPARKALLLGSSLLLEDVDFAELVSLAVIQIIDRCLARYPTSLAQDAALLAQLQPASQPPPVVAGDPLPASPPPPSPCSPSPVPKPREKTKGKAVKAGPGAAGAQAEQQAVGSQPVGEGGPSGPGDEAAALSKQRKLLAVLVRMGEKEVLMRSRRQVVELVLKLKEVARRLALASMGSAKNKSAKKRPASAVPKPVLGTAAAPATKKKKKKRTPTEDAKEAGSGRVKRNKASGSASATPKKEKASGPTPAVDGERDSDDDDDGLLASDDSDKVGYGPEEYDDGIGEAHDRGGAHPAPAAKQ